MEKDSSDIAREHEEQIVEGYRRGYPQGGRVRFMKGTQQVGSMGNYSTR